MRAAAGFIGDGLLGSVANLFLKGEAGEFGTRVGEAGTFRVEAGSVSSALVSKSYDYLELKVVIHSSSVHMMLSCR